MGGDFSRPSWAGAGQGLPRQDTQFCAHTRTPCPTPHGHAPSTPQPPPCCIPWAEHHATPSTLPATMTPSALAVSTTIIPPYRCVLPPPYLPLLHLFCPLARTPLRTTQTTKEPNLWARFHFAQNSGERAGRFTLAFLSALALRCPLRCAAPLRSNDDAAYLTVGLPRDDSSATFRTSGRASSFIPASL